MRTFNSWGWTMSPIETNVPIQCSHTLVIVPRSKACSAGEFFETVVTIQHDPRKRRKMERFLYKFVSIRSYQPSLRRAYIPWQTWNCREQYATKHSKLVVSLVLLWYRYDHVSSNQTAMSDRVEYWKPENRPLHHKPGHVRGGFLMVDIGITVIKFLLSKMLLYFHRRRRRKSYESWMAFFSASSRYIWKAWWIPVGSRIWKCAKGEILNKHGFLQI